MSAGFFMEILETERLILRSYAEVDKTHLIELFTDEIVMKSVDRGVMSVVQAEKLWTKLMGQMYPQGVDTIYAVWAKADLRYVGHASIRPRPMQKDHWEIGYILRTGSSGKGFATEIAKRLIKHGFEKVGLNEIYATIDEDNFGSIRVAEKAGMSFLRYEFDEQGRFSVYSINAAIRT
jgi:RimJ/RimL family protein N-acetyltransferase